MAGLGWAIGFWLGLGFVYEFTLGAHSNRARAQENKPDQADPAKASPPLTSPSIPLANASHLATVKEWTFVPLRARARARVGKYNPVILRSEEWE